MKPSSTHPRHSTRRRGQALLLAVLIMLFVALLGTTFIAVVAINIGQTSRQEERDKAKLAAQAGLAFANQQLTYSDWGMRWTPTDATKGGVTPPLSGDASYNTYWTPFDQAQGWHNAGYAKFPDPRSQNQNLSAPNYMVKVEKVLSGASDNVQGDKTGALRITVIGQSSDDPNSFQKIVAYKAGPSQQPLTGAMRSVSNWDFANSAVPSALTTNSGSTASAATSTMTVSAQSGSFASRTNFCVTLSSASGGNVRYAVIAAADAAGTTFTLAPAPLLPTAAASPAPPVVTWVAGERVEIAATLGAPSTLDFDNNNALDAAKERVNFRASTVAAPGSVWANGGLVLSGNAYLQNLRDPNQASSSAPGTIQASGLIAVKTAGSATVAGVLQSGTTTGDQALLNSSDSNFPFTGAGTTDERLRLVSDGLNRLNNAPDATRQTRSFAPPDMTAGQGGLGRYRQLTQYSDPANSGDAPQVSAYGYGRGIYINNIQDKEQFKPSTGTRREMTQSELEQLWFSATVPASANTDLAFLRAGNPITRNDATTSLEQQHLRGWVAPDEFVPRGVLVEINADSTLTITRDSHSDDATYVSGTTGPLFNEGATPSKGWLDNDGTLAGDDTYGGVYTKTFSWPANGVLFTEGNIRIRGKASNINPPRNLTVVSMSNIYIEDSLSAGDKKILLLAKKNVVVNPTRVLGRPEAFTRLVSRSANIITVQSSAGFRVGDRIETVQGNGESRNFITAISGNVLTLSAALSSGTTGTTLARLQFEPYNTASPSRPFYGTATPYFDAETHAFSRRFWLDGAPGAVRIALRHGAEYRQAISVAANGVTPIKVDLGNKLLSPAPAAPPLQIASAEKLMMIENTSGADTFPSTPATDTITSLSSQFNNKYPKSPTPGATWWYDSTVTTTKGDYSALPYRYLAGVGLRSKFNPALVLSAFPYRQSILSTVIAADKEFPIGTSVKVSINGADAGLQLDDGSGGFSTVNQIGFSPNLSEAEDALTTDRSFYTPLTGGASAKFDYLTNDSRRVANNLSANDWNTLVWRFHDDVLADFNDTASGGNPARPIPRYGINRIKLENLNQLNGNNAFETLDAGYTLDINAYVYAQEGSWLVIPGVLFNDKMRTDAFGGFQDLDGDNTRDPGENLDLNRDGLITRDEQAGVQRFLRYNYNIRFTGAIMENHTALIEDPDGTGVLRGPVTDWTDKWAVTKLGAGNFAGTARSDAFNASTLATANGSYNTIEYNFDASASQETLATLDGWQPPISSELLYQSG